MLARYSASFGSAAVVTFGLLLLMQTMIAMGPAALTDGGVYRIVDFVRVERTPPPPPAEPPERIPDSLPPPDLPPADVGGDSGPAVAVPTPRAPPLATPIGGTFGLVDGDLLPIVKVQPNYPVAALRRGLEGYVIVRFTVTRTGAVADVVVEESSSEIFERAAIEAAYKFRYRPRVLNGEAVDVHEVRNRVTFELDE